jgi:Rrf2 family protein
MMKISTKGRYALRAVIDLAENRNRGRISLKDIAKRQALSIKYLEAIFTKLCKKRVLKSKRGIHGGYTLGRPPDKISAYQVITAIEGSIAIAFCIVDRQQCRRRRTCKTTRLWRDINDTIIKKLKEKTIADFLGDKK